MTKADEFLARSESCRHWRLQRTAEDQAIIAGQFHSRLAPICNKALKLKAFGEAYMRAVCDYTEFPPHPYPIEARQKITAAFDEYPP